MSYGDPSQLIEENRKAYIAAGGKMNKPAMKLIEKFMLMAVSSVVVTGVIPSTVVELFRKVLKKVGTTEQEVRAKLGMPVCPYCKGEMQLDELDCPPWVGWLCGCKREKLWAIYEKIEPCNTRTPKKSE